MLFNITGEIQSLDNNSQTLKLDIKLAGAHYKLYKVSVLLSTLMCLCIYYVTYGKVPVPAGCVRICYVVVLCQVFSPTIDSRATE